MSLKNKTIRDSYGDLLNMDNSGSGVSTSALLVKDGHGNSSALSISDDVVTIRPVNDDTTGAFIVRAVGGTYNFKVDSTNDIVTASGNIVNTQYARFNIGATQSASFSANRHFPIPFDSAMFSDSSNPPSFGTGTDPATTYTTSDATANRASDIVPLLWYVHDDIEIDAVYGIQGSDNATGDVTRMHLMSYVYTSGDAASLKAGGLLAHNADITDAGCEQVYSSAWTVDEGTVSAGTAILAFFRSDSINSDYSINITVKYHLT